LKRNPRSYAVAVKTEKYIANHLTISW